MGVAIRVNTFVACAFVVIRLLPSSRDTLTFEFRTTLELKASIWYCNLFISHEKCSVKSSGSKK